MCLLTPVRRMCGDQVFNLACMQLASYLEGSPLKWMMLLHLHVNLNAAAADDDDDYDVSVR